MHSDEPMPSASTKSSEERESVQATMRNKVGLALGPIAMVLVWLLFDLDPDNSSVTAMAAIAVLMAIWWVTEAIPIAATALVPVVLFPLMGVMRGADVAREYMSWLIFLFLDGISFNRRIGRPR